MSTDMIAIAPGQDLIIDTGRDCRLGCGFVARNRKGRSVHEAAHDRSLESWQERNRLAFARDVTPRPRP
jgi:hypothetical protein